MNCMKCVAQWFLVLTLIFTVAGVPVVEAKPPEGKGNSAHKGNKNNKQDKHDKGGGKKDGGDKDMSGILISAGITVLEARNIAVQLHSTGYQGLPPGIRKNLGRGKPLPPGIAKKMVPGGMLSRLPVHPGYEWRIAGSDLILVAVATSIVADVLSDVFQ